MLTSTLSISTILIKSIYKNLTANKSSHSKSLNFFTCLSPRPAVIWFLFLLDVYEDDDSVVEEFWFVAQACRGSRLLAWHDVGDNGAVLGGLLSAPLPGYGGVAFCLRALFVWW